MKPPDAVPGLPALLTEPGKDVSPSSPPDPPSPPEATPESHSRNQGADRTRVRLLRGAGFPALITEPGMDGFFTRAEAPGALGNGTRIKKNCEEPGDTHKKDALGTVLGSFGPMPYDEMKAVYGYFIAWDDMPKRAVLCVSFRLDPIVSN